MTTTTLLRTKLYIPRLVRTIVRRQALIRRLNEGIDRDVTLVVAPVGYGKTTLVASWAEQAALPVVWLTLNEGDNELTVFTSYVVAAIRTRFPDACPRTYALTDIGRTPDVELLATLLINEIDDLPQQFVLVLDDYHFIRARVVHQFLDRLLYHPPLQMRLLIASRADPPLVLARVRANQQLNEVRIKDLRFSKDESEAFLAQVLAPAEVPEAADVLASRTEGWIAGLQLAVLSLRTASDRQVVLTQLARGTDRYIMDYLFEQVLNQQPPRVQTFLLKTSILTQLSSGLVEVIVADEEEPGDSQVSLAMLERAGIFVSSLDASGEWYGYHALFRELLRHQLRLRYSAQQIAALHIRAGEWLRGQGMVDDALHHMLAASEIDRAAQIIVDHFATWLDRENWPAIERWLNLLPAAAFASHPWLLVARANIAQLRSDYGAVMPLLEEAEARLAGAMNSANSSGEAVLRSYMNLLWAIHWLLSGQTAQAVDSLHQSLSALPTTHHYVRGTALNLLTMAMQISGELEHAKALIEQELARTPRGVANAYPRLRLLLCRMSLHLADGDIAAGEPTATMMLEEATAFDAPVSRLWAHLALGVIAYEANNLPRALHHFSQGMELRSIGHMRAGHECLVGLAMTYYAMRRTAEARGVVNVLSEYHRQSGNVALATETRLLRLHLDVLSGIPPDHYDWGSPQAAYPALLLGWKVIPGIIRVYALLAEATPAAFAAARVDLDELIAMAAALRKPARQAELLALKARLLDQQGLHAEAVTVLKQAVFLGAPRGLIRSLADAGPQLEPVLHRLAPVAPSPYLDRILDALQPADPRLAENEPLRLPAVRLTRREREVLALLAAYRTDREIADELVISPLTVRTHIEHLSEKLAVSGRREIVARAMELNLVK